MAFEPKEWQDGVEGGTPVTADELNRIEQGIADAATHTHTIANVTGLQAALNDKQDSGDYATEDDLADLAARVTALENALE